MAGPKGTAPSSQSESKPEAQENAPAGGQLTADKVRDSAYQCCLPGKVLGLIVGLKDHNDDTTHFFLPTN